MVPASVELRGTPAAPGAAVGAAWTWHPAATGGGRRTSIAEAASTAAAELERLAAELRTRGAAEEAGILEAQALMAADPELLDPATEREAAGVDGDAAITAVGEELAGVFDALDDELLAARAADIRDVAARIARHVVGAAAPRLDGPSVAVAADLPPSVTVELDRELLVGIALEGGSRTSHAAILARSLGIPAVVAVQGLLERVVTATALAVDGDAGTVVIDPDDRVRERVTAAAARAVAQREADAALAREPMRTADGHRVVVAANIGDPSEAARAFEAGAEAIGLFRTEFAFADRRTAPTEEEQADAYARVLDAAGNRPVVFRLADIGGDKPVPFVPMPREENPFLGVRAIRLVDRAPDLFATQLRAILRASATTTARASIMAPMVADEADLALVRRLVDEARAAVPDAPAPRVGIMVEVPSAVLLSDRLAQHVDFFSIGTNDLTQYLLAADRSNAELAHRQDPLHPAVLRAVRTVVAAARAHPCEVAVCGEMAGDPVGATLLVGLGVDELSMAPAALGAAKRAVAARNLGDWERLATAALDVRSAEDVRALMEGGA